MTSAASTVSTDALRSVFCGATLAGLAYALYSTTETVDSFGDYSGKIPAEGEGSGAGNAGTVPPQGAHLLLSVQMSHALSTLSPLLLRVDPEGLKEVTDILESICASSSQAMAREVSPTAALVRSLVAKRSLFSRLKELNRVARRRLPLEAADAAPDFNALVLAVNDAMSNLEKESSLQLMVAS